MSDDMSHEVIETVVASAGPNRRQFLVTLIAGSAFAVPAIASFAIGGSSSASRSPLDAGSNTDCGSNIDGGSNIDAGSNICLDLEPELPATE